MNNAQKILDKISIEDIRPEKRWTFTSKEWLKWIIYTLFLILGSISFSIILFSISINGFDLIQHSKHSKLEAILVALPIFWLSLLLFFMIVSIVSIMQTGRAYKYSFDKWIGLTTGISMTIGTLFFISGGAQWLEHKFESNISSYESLMEKKTAIWSRPELGTLSGEVIDVAGDTVKMRDWNNTVWSIDISKAFIAPVLQLEEGTQIKLNGTKTGKNIFAAERVKPWGGMPGKCMDTIR